MTKKDILELRRRLKKNDCTFTRLRGCYVDGDKNILLHINESFLNLPEEELYKYMEIAKKTLSGTVGNNLLELAFSPESAQEDGRQQFLLGLRESRLKSDGLLDRLYELIIENYEYTGNYLILIFHDVYDVMIRTSDNNKMDASEEVYEYLLCAICPVELTKAGLGYREDENRIGVCDRDWVVGAPENGFVFPAFSERSADIHSLIYYTKNPKEPHTSFMEAGLGCEPRRTAAVQKIAFQSIVESAVGAQEERAQEIFLDLQQGISDMLEEHEATYGDEEPVVLTEGTMQSIIAETPLPQEVAEKIEASYQKEFGDELPTADHLIDAKALSANAIKKKEQALQKEVFSLKQRLEELDSAQEEYAVVLNVKPEKVAEIKTQMIDGQRCIVIPIREEEQAVINGETEDWNS